MGTKSSASVSAKWQADKLAKRKARAKRTRINIALRAALAGRVLAMKKVQDSIRKEKIKEAGKRREIRDMVREQTHPFLRVVATLTNWQRNRWARDGYPGLSGSDPVQVQDYADLVKPKTRRERVLV